VAQLRAHPMSKPTDGLVAVDAGLVGTTLVEAVFTRVQRLEAPDPPWPASAALDDPDLSLIAGSEGRLEMQMRRAGYLARVVEVELFDPAKRPTAWLATLVTERFSEHGDWAAALGGACAELARAEPVGKPHPDDPAAATWRIPGPGGHVRHYVARRTIEELLQGRDRPLDGEPAELKIPWAYGFFVRACEEVLPRDAICDAGR
jgi:hypothetical protein